MLKITIKNLLVAGCWWAFSLQAAPQHVAHVRMAVGDAQRVDASGRIEPLITGMELQERDRIITGKDAMVILVFSDQARVALRPDSELIIQRYKIDPTGVDTELHLSLVRGTVRQISGSAAHKQPERYRLNTPIAAIGVRGTDFLAKADNNVTEAYVHEGGIVVSPFGNIDLRSKDPSSSLKAGSGVHYSYTQRNSELEHKKIDQDDMERLFGIRIAAATNAENSKVAVAKPEATVVASLFSVKDKDAAAMPPQTSSPSPSDGLPPSANIVPPAALPPILPPVVVAPLPPPVEVAPLPPPVVVTPLPPPVVVAPLPPPVVIAPLPPPVPSLPPPPAQLVWGRFSNPQTLPFTLPQPYETAKTGRHPTVGELGQYALWRDGTNGTIDKSLHGQANFSLTAGEAFYQQADQTLALKLASPRLQIDFDQRSFKTQLELSGSGVPGQQLNVSGRMSDEGLLVGTATDQRIAGAISRNGAEAGYLFKIDKGAGQYQGITLWNAK